MYTQTKITSYYGVKASKKTDKVDNKKNINFCKRGISRHSRIQNLLIKRIHTTNDLRTSLRTSAVKSLLQKVSFIVTKRCGAKNYPCHIFKEVSFFYNQTKRCDLVLYIPDAHLLFLIELKTTSNRKVYEKSIKPWQKQISCTFHQAVMSICRSSSSPQKLCVYSLLTTRLYHINRSDWKYNEDTTKITHRNIINGMPSISWLKTKAL